MVETGKLAAVCRWSRAVAVAPGVIHQSGL